jgi:hypothetical protein
VGACAWVRAHGCMRVCAHGCPRQAGGKEHGDAMQRVFSRRPCRPHDVFLQPIAHLCPIVRRRVRGCACAWVRVCMGAPLRNTSDESDVLAALGLGFRV